MTTKIVPKGANRPAAAKRTAKAAQRTPLPPKPGQVQDAKDAIAAAKRVPNTATGRKLAAAAKASAVTKPKPPVGATPHDKAAKLVEEAKVAGWAAAAEVGELPGDLVTFHAVRGNPVSEVLTLHWITGGTRPGTYTNGGREVQAMNAATVRRILATPAEAAAKVRAAYASGKGKAKRAAVKVATAAPLSFDAASATDVEILETVKGRTLTWTNGTSGMTETAVVSGKVSKNYPKLQGEGDARVLTFWSLGEGARSLRVKNIISIS